jgi:uncharacterized membrane-anchored protein YhcB (DUF1043 family)
MVTWVVFLTIGLVIGIAAGFFFGQLDGFKRRQREELQSKLESTQKELIDYKQEVTSHFVKTSTLVNNLTESYKAVHEHLAGGAKVLCDSQFQVKKLNIEDVKLIDEKTETPVPPPVTAFASASTIDEVKPVNSDNLSADKNNKESSDKIVVNTASAKKPQSVKPSKDEKIDTLTTEIPSDSVANKEVLSTSTPIASTVDVERSTKLQSDNEQAETPHTRTVH